MRVEGLVRRLQEVDPLRIRALLDKLTDELFVAGDAAKDRSYRAFSSADHVMLRYPASSSEAPYREPFWSMFQDDVEPLCHETADFYGYERYDTSRIVIARVKPNGRVETHIDKAVALHAAHRVHIPLQTHPEAVMTFKKLGLQRRQHLEIGHAWEVHNTGYHGVENPTPVPRIHLYFDLIPPRA